MSEKLNKVSSRITQPRSQGASQAMLYATGLTCEDMDKAQVGIASMWWQGNPCNMHLNDLADQIATGVRESDLIPMRFNTIGVSDGISMGTEGMSYSLQSRDLIADSIETVMGGQWYDALVTWIALALASSKAVTHFCLSTSEEALKVTAVRIFAKRRTPQGDTQQ